MEKYQVVEIFSSLQGEGINTGRPVVFTRLARCNLNCAWCDTEHGVFTEMTLEAILSAIKGFGLDSVVVTGGEPTVHQGFDRLVAALREAGYWVALETNGVAGLTAAAANNIDFIAVSPKAAYAGLYSRAGTLAGADEVRVVVDGNVRDFCEFIEERIPAAYYFLSPRARADNTFDLLPAVKALHELNSRPRGRKWALSFQTHKLCGIP